MLVLPGLAAYSDTANTFPMNKAAKQMGPIQMSFVRTSVGSGPVTRATGRQHVNALIKRVLEDDTLPEMEHAAVEARLDEIETKLMKGIARMMSAGAFQPYPASGLFGRP